MNISVEQRWWNEALRRIDRAAVAAPVRAFWLLCAAWNQWHRQANSWFGNSAGS